MTKTKVIPISPLRTDGLDEIDALQDRLERAGYMRMMQIGEPRLSELVAKYKSKGYDVEVAPYVDDGDEVGDGSVAPSGGCGPSSCSSASSSGGCSSGGCGSAPSPARRAGPRVVVPNVGTIYVRINGGVSASA